MTLRILVLCTGNICRSPMAEGFLRAGTKAVGVDAQIASAGTVEGGKPPEPYAVEVMADRGIDISRHVSHQVTEADIEAADLILGMAREHVIAAAALVPHAFGKATTLKDFVAGAEDVGPKPAHSTVEDWFHMVHDGRVHADMLRADDTTDIADPLGQGRRAFERTAAEIDELVWAAVDLLAGYLPKALPH